MNVFQWLKVGIALFLTISKPQIIMDNELIKTKFQMSNLLTDEMIGLVNNGMDLEYEAYVSILATDYSNKKFVFKNKIRRKIKFDYLNTNYVLFENEKLCNSFKKISDLITEAKKYETTFGLNSSKYSSLNFFIEIRLVENPIIENNLKMKTSDLWNGYKPSVKFLCDSKGDEL